MSGSYGQWPDDGIGVLLLLLPFYLTWLLVKWGAVILLWIVIRGSQAIYRWWSVDEVDERFRDEWRAGYDRASASRAA